MLKPKMPVRVLNPLRITVQISANANRNEIIGWQDNRLKIRIKAPAVEGRANDAVVRFLAEQLGIRRREICIERGTTSTIKVIAFASQDVESLREKLGRPLQSSGAG